MRRVVIPELLDEDAGSAHEIATSLRDLRRINRWFGGISTTRSMLNRAAMMLPNGTFSLLDVGAGAGDIPIALHRDARRPSRSTEVTLLDRSPAHLTDNHFADAVLAGSSKPETRNSAVRRVVGDATSLPFANSSFDVVTCSLFAHHLEPAQFTAFAAEALRVCRIAVLVNDLRRNRLSLALVYAGFFLYRSRLTRHDAPASVRRAYSLDEMTAMLRRAGAHRVDAAPHYLFRMAAIAWKTECTT
jgi:ubiquinone/menaquinone biosynthesis C-methylase UbiE